MSLHVNTTRNEQEMWCQNTSIYKVLSPISYKGTPLSDSQKGTYGLLRNKDIYEDIER